MILVDVDLPTKCEECAFYNGEGGSCFIISVNPKRKLAKNGRPKECPIIGELKQDK